MAEAGTLATNADIVKLAGSGVNAAAVLETFTNATIVAVEGIICANCRYDFVTNYASLDNNLKLLLRGAVATRAAIWSINYDMSGYTSRTEAELMMNVLWTLHNQDLELLKDQKTVTWGT